MGNRQEILEQYTERLVVIEHPLIAHKLSVLRDKRTPISIFRDTARELTMLEVYEATRDIPTTSVEIETPLATTVCETINGREPVIVPILRAGLAMQDAFTTLIPTAPIAHLGMYRDEETHEPIEYLAKMPPYIADRSVLLVDPMLATGGSLIAAIKTLRERGVKHLICVVMVAAPEGVQRVLEFDPEVRIFTAALDDCLNDDAFILPGLGDAGDRIFGTLAIND